MQDAIRFHSKIGAWRCLPVFSSAVEYATGLIRFDSSTGTGKDASQKQSRLFVNIGMKMKNHACRQNHSPRKWRERKPLGIEYREIPQPAHKKGSVTEVRPIEWTLGSGRGLQWALCELCFYCKCEWGCRDMWNLRCKREWGCRGKGQGKKTRYSRECNASVLAQSWNAKFWGWVQIDITNCMQARIPCSRSEAKWRVGQNHICIYIYIWCIYDIFGREITKYTVHIYGSGQL